MTLIIALFVGLVPIPALAVGIGSGTAEFLGPDLTLTFSNDPLSDQDIVEIVIDGSTADNGPITWAFAGFPFDPPGASSTIAGEGTTEVTVSFTPGFDPGEDFILFDVDADPGVPLLADLIDVTVSFTFEDTTTTQLVFKPDDPGDPEAGLTLVPEPRTSILVALGLSGLAMAGRRRA